MQSVVWLLHIKCINYEYNLHLHNSSPSSVFGSFIDLYIVFAILTVAIVAAIAVECVYVYDIRVHRAIIPLLCPPHRARISLHFVDFSLSLISACTVCAAHMHTQDPIENDSNLLSDYQLAKYLLTR